MQLYVRTRQCELCVTFLRRFMCLPVLSRNKLQAKFATLLQLCKVWGWLQGQHIIPCFKDACFKAPSEPYFTDLSSFIHQVSNWKNFTTSFLNLPDTVFSSPYNNKSHFLPPMTGVVARPALTKKWELLSLLLFCAARESGEYRNSCCLALAAP